METNFKALEVERVIQLGDAELDIVSCGGAFVPPGKGFHDGGAGDDDDVMKDLEIQR